MQVSVWAVNSGNNTESVNVSLIYMRNTPSLQSLPTNAVVVFNLLSIGPSMIQMFICKLPFQTSNSSIGLSWIQNRRLCGQRQSGDRWCKASASCMCDFIHTVLLEYKRIVIYLSWARVRRLVNDTSDVVTECALEEVNADRTKILTSKLTFCLR